MNDEQVNHYLANCRAVVVSIQPEYRNAFIEEVRRLIHEVRSSALEQAADDLLRHLEPAGIVQSGVRSITEVRRRIMVLIEMYKRCGEDRERAQRLVATLQQRVDEWMKACERAEDGRDGWIPIEERCPEAGREIWVCNTNYTGATVRKILCEGADPVLPNVTHWKPVKAPLPPTPQDMPK